MHEKILIHIFPSRVYNMIELYMFKDKNLNICEKIMEPFLPNGYFNKIISTVT